MKRYLRIIVIFATFSLLIWCLNQIKINSIDCSSQYGPCNVDIKRPLEALSGTKLIGIKKEIRTILDGEFIVEDYLIQYKLPDKIAITVVERKPVYAAHYANTDVIVLFDKDGYVLSFQDTTSLAVLELSDTTPPDRGDKVSDGVLFSSEILKGVSSYYLVKKAEIKDGALFVKVDEAPTAIFPLDGDRDLLLGSFVAIFTKLNSGEYEPKIDDNISQVDLRFENPVLR